MIKHFSQSAVGHLRVPCLLVAACVCLSHAALAHPMQDDPQPSQNEDTPKTIDELVAGLERAEGLFTFHRDHTKGRLLLEIPPATGERGEAMRCLLTGGLMTGLGSNPVGLDRGQLGDSHLIVFRRVGGRIIVEAINLNYRAVSDDPAEREAVRQSFATSILWSGEILAEDEAGRTLVDFTSFVVRDAHNVASTLKRSNQGAYSLAADRSVIDLDQCLAFPDNVEFEALLTFTTDEPGGETSSTAPTGRAVTLTQHHSLVRLPDDNYTPRVHDPRISSFAIDFIDYATDLDEPLTKRWIVRHRLQKRNPNAAQSEPVEPIVYYVDRGAPEPVRSALIEGARWWNEAFEAAGFIDAFRVEVMPEDAHPLDVRYNVIQWVHRSTRGWSYGGSVIDPRTGEIIKGHVSLGSLRVRQDRLIFEGLLGVAKTGSGDADDPVQLALSRIRQLSAHEVGHTLGFAHNFAASTYGGRASVMDYPAPLVTMNDTGDGLDTSDVYAVGIGAWDTHAVRYAYTQLPPGTTAAQERDWLDQLAASGPAEGLIFLSDADARPNGAAHPLANLWDNGSTPIEGLRDTLAVRNHALARFGERNIATGRPRALLHEVFVPVYLFHRYQITAAIKMVGGRLYEYAIAGAERPPVGFIDPNDQRAALQLLLQAIRPESLDVPDGVLDLLDPRPFGYGENRELFATGAAPAFDAIGAAATAAQPVIDGLLNPQRAMRLLDQHRRDPAQPGFDEIASVLTVTVLAEPDEARLQPIQQAIVDGLVSRLMQLAADTDVAGAIRDIAERELARVLSHEIDNNRGASIRVRSIRRFLERGVVEDSLPAQPPASQPPGDPIGCSMEW